jgi:hypothetical protein
MAVVTLLDNDKIHVELSWAEMTVAAHAGVLRASQNIELKSNLSVRGEPPHEVWQRMILGCLTEYAFASAFDLHWTGKGKIGSSDFRGIEVRGSEKPHAHLIAHQSDAGSKAVWLVTGWGNSFVVHGWEIAGQMKRDKYWGDHFLTGRPCFAVHQSALRKPQDFPAFHSLDVFTREKEGEE